VPASSGLSVGGSVAGQELADPKFHPVWAKAEELGILIFNATEMGEKPIFAPDFCAS
jgi:hypothetical protein